MKIEEAFLQFVGQEVLVYTRTAGTLDGGIIECVVEEVGEGWVRIAQGEDEEKNISIVNTENIVRIREYPRKKNGKKKMVIT